MFAGWTQDPLDILRSQTFQSQGSLAKHKEERWHVAECHFQSHETGLEPSGQAIQLRVVHATKNP